MAIAPYSVSCHYKNVQLEIAAELSEVYDCNCSICSRTGFLHWYVAREAVLLVTEKRRISTYVWRSVTSGQHFCSNCGIAVIRTSIQHPPPVSVNARCIDRIDLAALTIRQFDGKNLVP